MPINLRNLDARILKAARRVGTKRHNYDRIFHSKTANQEQLQTASFELTTARQNLDFWLIEVDPQLRGKAKERDALVDLIEELAIKQTGTYAHPQFFVVGEDSLCFKRLAPGTVVPEWQTLFLRQEAPKYSADNTHTCSETELSEPFTVPETVNGHYYAVEVWNT